MGSDVLLCIPLENIIGEDSVLFYWQREAVQSIKYRGANNCGTCVFVESNDFLMREMFLYEYSGTSGHERLGNTYKSG